MNEELRKLLLLMIEDLGSIHQGGCLYETHSCGGCDGEPIGEDWNAQIVHKPDCLWIQSMRGLGVEPEVLIENPN